MSCVSYAVTSKRLAWHQLTWHQLTLKNHTMSLLWLSWLIIFRKAWWLLAVTRSTKWPLIWVSYLSRTKASWEWIVELWSNWRHSSIWWDLEWLVLFINHKSTYLVSICSNVEPDSVNLPIRRMTHSAIFQSLILYCWSYLHFVAHRLELKIVPWIWPQHYIFPKLFNFLIVKELKDYKLSFLF